MTSHLAAARLLCTIAATALPFFAALARPSSAAESPRHGGRLVVALRSEPKTLNPFAAVDATSREVLALLHADLIRINRATQDPEPALAESFRVSKDGRRYTVRLRTGLKFSNGEPLTAEDVVFSFQAHLDERTGSPQRELLVVHGNPIAVRAVDPRTVEFALAAPYAAAERLFDGFPIVPRRQLEGPAREGKLADAWGLATPPDRVVGCGPFRVKEYEPGQRLVLARQSNYWKRDSAGRRLPYLDEIVFLFVPTEDAQALRFQAGETDVLTRIGADNFEALGGATRGRDIRLVDLGPGLEYTFLAFNLNDPQTLPAPVRARRAWFDRIEFRGAVSLAADRDGMARLAFRGKATPLGGHVPPGNRWANPAIRPPVRSLEAARALLKGGGFSWRGDGALVDANNAPVAFSIVVSSSNAPRVKVATILQDDLKQLGMKVSLATLDGKAVLDRITRTKDFDVALLSLASGDADPNGEMNVWLSNGPSHFWRLGEGPVPAWEREVDRLMKEQLSEHSAAARRKLYDRVQVLVAENLPIVPLIAPRVLVGASTKLGNFAPALLPPHALWNADELYWREPRR